MSSETKEKKSKNELKKEDIYPFLDVYYKSVGRLQPPNYKNYSLQELKKCLILFNIKLTKDTTA
jgi:hypothetical protein